MRDLTASGLLQQMGVEDPILGIRSWLEERLSTGSPGPARSAILGSLPPQSARPYRELRSNERSAMPPLGIGFMERIQRSLPHARLPGRARRERAWCLEPQREACRGRRWRRAAARHRGLGPSVHWRDGGRSRIDAIWLAASTPGSRISRRWLIPSCGARRITRGRM